jgi:RHS repeat-associated protein
VGNVGLCAPHSRTPLPTFQPDCCSVTQYDAAARPDRVYWQLNSAVGRNYVGNGTTTALYAPQGVISQMLLGNGVPVAIQYNSRLQPTSIQAGTSGNLLSLGYTYGTGTTTDNGNVLGQTIGRGSQTWNQSYAYDAVNRLTCANEAAVNGSAVTCVNGSASGNWSQSYCYDARGNRWLTSASSLVSTSDTPTASGCSSGPYNGNNHISCSGCSWAYDAAGNVTTSGTPRTFTFDAENRQKTAYINSESTVYTYDGDGKRVMRVVCPSTLPASCTTSSSGAVLTVFVYDPFGNLAQEYGTPTDSGTKFFTTDGLGSTRLITDNSGSATWTYDYLPFGDELQQSTNGRTASTYPSGSYPHPPSGPGLEFTSKERDAETGLDFFGARYFSSAQGRFTSPDKPLIDQDPTDPQSWNLYGYVRNNPLRFSDPTGQYCVSGGGNAYYDDDQGGQTCAEAFDPKNNNQASVTVTGNRDGSQSGYDQSGALISFLPNTRDSIQSRPDQMLAGMTLLRGLGASLARGIASRISAALAARALAGKVLTGFSESEIAMIQRSLSALEAAGYDTGQLTELVKADFGGRMAGMSLGENGAALANEAFESQPMLNHVLEEELLHTQQAARGLSAGAGPGAADALEGEVESMRQFPDPRN